jgi:hypothetical protein
VSPQNQKITLEIPRDLLARAQRVSGQGITATVRQGLSVLAAADAYASLRKLRGTLSRRQGWKELKDDRC